MPDHTTTSAVSDKPVKPYPDFPLFPHATRRWAKKIKGRVYYFGPWADWQGALAKYQAQRDDLYAGRKPRPAAGEGLTVEDLANHFLTAKRHAVELGELTARTFGDYDGTAERVITKLGPGRLVEDLRSEDFAEYRVGVARRWGYVALGNEVQRVRTMFKFAFDNGLIDRPVRFGSEFAKPSRKVMRLDKASKAPRLFARGEILALLKAAPLQARAMILLGINCGWGNSDISELDWTHLDLDAGVATFPRPKTGIARRATLWPETVDTLRKLERWAHEPLTVGTRKGQPRYQPAEFDDTHAVFITLQGRRFVRHDGRSIRDSVAMMFGKLLRTVTVKGADGKKQPLKRPGVNFYTLRHTFRTVADPFPDQHAIALIMGHIVPGMAGTHVEEIGDERLRRVTDCVRLWLWPDKAPTARPAAVK